MLTVQEALRTAAAIVEATPIPDKRDSVKELSDKRDGFFVRYEPNGGLDTVTLHVEMRFVQNRTMCLKVQVSHGSQYRTPAEARKFIALLTLVTELGERIEEALSGQETFEFEVKS